MFFTNSNSIVLKGGSAAILESLSKANKLGGSGLNIIIEFEKILPGIVKEQNAAVNKLSEYIGNFTITVNVALNDFGSTYTKFLKDFIESSKTGYKKQIDFEPVLRQLQKLLNAVALVAETSLNDCKLSTSKVHEAASVLTLISTYFTSTVQGINSCVQTMLYEQKITISPKIVSCSVTLRDVVAKQIQSIDLITVPFTVSIKVQLQSFINITIFLNSAWKEQFGTFKGVPITVGEITKLSHLSSKIDGKLAEMLKGLPSK